MLVRNTRRTALIETIIQKAKFFTEDPDEPANSNNEHPARWSVRVGFINGNLVFLEFTEGDDQPETFNSMELRLQFSNEDDRDMIIPLTGEGLGHLQTATLLELRDAFEFSTYCSSKASVRARKQAQIVLSSN